MFAVLNFLITFMLSYNCDTLLIVLHQGYIEPPKAARGHATHIDGIVLNVIKFRIQILCSLHCLW